MRRQHRHDDKQSSSQIQKSPGDVGCIALDGNASLELIDAETTNQNSGIKPLHAACAGYPHHPPMPPVSLANSDASQTNLSTIRIALRYVDYL